MSEEAEIDYDQFVRERLLECTEALGLPPALLLFEEARAHNMRWAHRAITMTWWEFGRMAVAWWRNEGLSKAEMRPQWQRIVRGLDFAKAKESA